MKHVIGIDIGGSKIEGIVFDGRKIIKNLSIVTPKTLPGLQYSLLHLLKFLSSGHDISGVGVGMAGLVHPKKGIVEASPNLPYVKNFNAVKFLKSKGFSHAAVQNDAKCFALAELKLGQAKKKKDVLCITLGTGIGGAIVINGQVYGGTQNMAGEVGHGFLNADSSWERLYQQTKKPHAGVAKDHNFKKISELSAKAIVAACYILDPELIIFGGSLTGLYQKYFLPQAAALAKKQSAMGSFFPKVVASKLKSAGSIGAALMVI